MVRISVYPFVRACFWTLVAALSAWNIWVSFSLQETKDSNVDTIQSAGNLFWQSKQKPNNQAVHFIPIKQLDVVDSFSACWWQSKERFVRIFDPKRIINLEGSLFRFTEVLDMAELRMTSDWLQFSVEHLSKVWKLTGFESPQETLAYHMYIDKFLGYSQRTLKSKQFLQEEAFCRKTSSLARCSSSNAMRQTIALIAFMPYTSTRGQALCTASLVATLASLIRVFCGRIVIVIDRQDFDDPGTPPVLMATKQLLLRHSLIERNSLERYLTLASKRKHDTLRPPDFEFRVFSTEIALAVVNCSSAEGTVVGDQRILQKAALLGLFRAFQNSQQRHPAWFGKRGADYWNFTYITEPDTFLQAKASALPALSQEVRQGNIVVPHRLQPIPHARDIPKYSGLEHLVLANQGKFAKVVTLDSNLGHACCDAGISKPGAFKEGELTCDDFWWLCGFHHTDGRIENHVRLNPYDLIDLQQGSRIVSLSATEHGRQCIPKTNGEVCRSNTTTVG